MRAPQRQLVPVVGSEAAQRKQLPERAAAEEHDQEHAEDEARDREAEHHEEGRDGIEARSLAHRLGDAERHRDQVRDQEGPQAEADRDRELFLDQRPDRLALHEARAEVEGREVLQHLDIAHVRGLVEAVELLQRLDLLGVDVAARLVRAARADARLRHDLLDRSAGDELDDDEGDRQHAQQGGQHQGDALEDVAQHGRRRLQRFSASLAHHDVIGQASRVSLSGVTSVWKCSGCTAGTPNLVQ